MKYKLKANPACVESTQQNVDSNLIADNSEPEGGTQSENILQLFGDMNFKEFSKKIDPNTITETSPYVKVQNKKGEIICVEKHTLCWYLTKSTSKLSSERLLRVMAKAP